MTDEDATPDRHDVGGDDQTGTDRGSDGSDAADAGGAGDEDDRVEVRAVPEIDDPAATLAGHERALTDWLDRLRDRRDRLAELGEAFDDLDREDLPESVADSLSTLLSTLEADLDAQIADLEGEIERVRKLRATLERASGETVTEELETYVETMDGVLGEKRETVEQLVGTTDRLVDRFERVIEGR